VPAPDGGVLLPSTSAPDALRQREKVEVAIPPVVVKTKSA